MEQLPDKNIYMMCETLRKEALSELPVGYTVRSCRKDELPVWKAMPFDDPATAREYEGFMEEYFQNTYAGKEGLFFANTLFVCTSDDIPVATCLLWKAYDTFNSIHWFKVVKAYEGKGIGRGLLSIIMKDLPAESYPVYLHTQPDSYRAIKLYSDFGFQLLSGKGFGPRENDLEECLPILQQYMPKEEIEKLKIVPAPTHLRTFLSTSTTIQF